MKNVILKIDGWFLTIMGTAAAFSELIAYFLGKGPFGKVYYQNPITIGGFEAHCLAIIVGLIFISGSKHAGPLNWNKVAIAVHLVLGTSNLIWWQSFVSFDVLAMGYITTIFHYCFVSLNMLVLFKKKKMVNA